MTDRPILQPTVDHPITIEPTGGRVTVRVNGELIADTREALTLRESTYPAVQYVPLRDVAGDRLVHSNTATYCPFKGDAGYYHVATQDGVVDDVIWEYRQPYPAVSAIGGHVAFYPQKADILVEPA
jgi:uncharacterized protein (DUF427 family)